MVINRICATTSDIWADCFLEFLSCTFRGSVGPRIFCSQVLLNFSCISYFFFFFKSITFVVIDLDSPNSKLRSTREQFRALWVPRLRGPKPTPLGDFEPFLFFGFPCKCSKIVEIPVTPKPQNGTNSRRL
jgi:hypothetical protein